MTQTIFLHSTFVSSSSSTGTRPKLLERIKALQRNAFALRWHISSWDQRDFVEAAGVSRMRWGARQQRSWFDAGVGVSPRPSQPSFAAIVSDQSNQGNTKEGIDTNGRNADWTFASWWRRWSWSRDWRFGGCLLGAWPDRAVHVVVDMLIATRQLAGNHTKRSRNLWLRVDDTGLQDFIDGLARCWATVDCCVESIDGPSLTRAEQWQQAEKI